MLVFSYCINLSFNDIYVCSLSIYAIIYYIYHICESCTFDDCLQRVFINDLFYMNELVLQ